MAGQAAPPRHPDSLAGRTTISIDTATPTVAPGVRPQVPRLAAGTELLGEYHGSGFTEPRYLIRRGDGQVAQLPRMLYLLASQIDGRRDAAALASDVSRELGRDLTGEQAAFLVEERLRPVGILDAEPSGTDAEAPGASTDLAPTGGAVGRPDPLFLLRYRLPVIPERLVWHVAGPFRPLYWTPVLVGLLSAFVALEGWLLAHGAMRELVPSALALIDQPFLNLLIFVLILASGMFHECGHVTACRYGGARPGTMGVGLYLVWPAMYSTVTDAYRLSRGGRLRVDLGGVYFNVLSILAMDVVYLFTGSPWLLIAIVSLHVETVWQFLPSVRLDGYYILADLVGIPDLFSRFVPILRSLRPGRSDPRVSELKPWVRRTVGLWVALVIPCLVFWLVAFIVLAPRLIPAAWDRALELVAEVTGGAPSLFAGVIAVGQLFLLVLPWAGGALISQNVGRRIVYALGARFPFLAADRGRGVARRALFGWGIAVLLVPLLGRAGYYGRLPVELDTALSTVGLVLVLGVAVDRGLAALDRRPPWPPILGWVAGIAVLAVVITTAGTPTASEPDPVVPLARYLEGQTDPATVVAVPSALEDGLVGAGVPAGRLRPLAAGEGATPGSVAVLDRDARPAELAVARFGEWTVVAPRTGASPQDARIRREAGTLLAQNPLLAAPPGVLDALQQGSVDARVTTVLAALTSRHRVGVAELPPVEGEVPGVPAHVIVVSDLDGRSVVDDPRAAADLFGWSGDLSPPFAPIEVQPRAEGVQLGWAVPVPVVHRASR